jgi:2'-5' RNA ligase
VADGQLGDSTSLLIPLPGLRQQLRGAARGRGRHRLGLPPHVTLLYPFVGAPAVTGPLRDRLRKLLSDQPAFETELTTLCSFPGSRTLCLLPAAAEPFARLTDLLHAAFPDHPPYEGRYPVVIPHVAVCTGPQRPGLSEALAARLPLRAAVSHVALVGRLGALRPRVLDRFPLAA